MQASSLGSHMTGSCGVSSGATVPLVKVSIVQSVTVPPCHWAVAPIRVHQGSHITEPLLVEHTDDFEQNTGLKLEDALMHPREGGLAFVNTSGFTLSVKEGTTVGTATELWLSHMYQFQVQRNQLRDRITPTA